MRGALEEKTNLVEQARVAVHEAEIAVAGRPRSVAVRHPLREALDELTEAFRTFGKATRDAR